MGESMSHPFLETVDKERSATLSHYKHFSGRGEDSVMGLLGIWQWKLKRKVKDLSMNYEDADSLFYCLCCYCTCLFVLKIIIFFTSSK